MLYDAAISYGCRPSSMLGMAPTSAEAVALDLALMLAARRRAADSKGMIFPTFRVA